MMKMTVIVIIGLCLVGCSNTFEGLKQDTQDTYSSMQQGWTKFKRDVGY